LQQNQAKQAAAVFEQALKVNPKVVTAVMELAKLNSGPLADRAKAMGYAKKARELSPANPEALHLLGQLTFQGGDIAGAYNLLQECQRLQSGNLQAAFDFAWAAYGLGKLDEARQAMEQAQTAQNQPNLVNAAKWFLSLLGHYENPQTLAGVEAQVNEMLKGDPNYVPGLLVIGLLQNQRGQTKEALQTFEKILARFPQFPPAQRALAILYSTDPAQEKKAFDLAMKARVTMPEDPALARTLGKIYHNRKDSLSAVRFLQDCLRNAPSDAEALYYLGGSYAQLKDKVKAKDALQKSLAAGLKAPLDAEAKRLLGTL
jgi:tetratricopeptide (TPR) repeat protein